VQTEIKKRGGRGELNRVISRKLGVLTSAIQVILKKPHRFFLIPVRAKSFKEATICFLVC
jgi:hypothetical protein